MRIGGVINIKIDGQIYKAKGDFDYDLGIPKKEMVVGMDGVHGYKEVPQVPYISGTITDDEDISLEVLARTKDSTVTLELANGKTVVLRNAIYAENAKGNSGEGEIETRFEGLGADEVR